MQPEAPTAEPVEEPNEAIESPEYDGDLQNKEYTIQVSAKHLAFASPVFMRILASGWKEGNHLSERSVGIVDESWDIDALLILLNIIHCRHRSLPRKISLELLAKVSVLADYYKCVEAVEYFAGHWISDLEGKIPASYSRDLFLWIWISWIFERSADFKCASSVAMRRAGRLIWNMGLPIPDPIILEMNQNRQLAICTIVDALHGQLDQLTRSNRNNCFDCSSIKLGTLTKEMYANSLLSPKPAAPFAGISFDRLQTTVGSFRNPCSDTELGCFYRSGSDCYYQCECRNLSIRFLPEGVQDLVAGLDLKDFNADTE